MKKIEEIVIKEDDEYTFGYRYIYNIKYLHLESDDMFFNKLINYKKLKDQLKDENSKKFLKNLTGFTNVVRAAYSEEVVTPAMNKLKRVKKKEYLNKIINDFVSAVYFYNKKNRGNEYEFSYNIIKDSLEKYPDLTTCVLIKHIVRLYYSFLVSNISNSEIKKIESCKIENYKDESVLDKIMENVDEKKIESDEAFYTYRKHCFSNLVSARFDNHRHHECGAAKSCSMEQFRNCEKVHQDVNTLDITQFPCVKKGIQVYTPNIEGKWVLDKFIVEECDYKRSAEIVPKKLLFKKEK